MVALLGLLGLDRKKAHGVACSLSEIHALQAERREMLSRLQHAAVVVLVLPKSRMSEHGWTHQIERSEEAMELCSLRRLTCRQKIDASLGNVCVLTNSQARTT
jgi:hypothetical protein